MKLTKFEKLICDVFSKVDETGYVHCFECPLNVDLRDHICYATIDGRTTEAKELRRYNAKKMPVTFVVDQDIPDDICFFRETLGES